MALQMGDVSKVVPIDKLSVVITIILAVVLLHENITMKSVAGCILIGDLRPSTKSHYRFCGVTFNID